MSSIIQFLEAAGSKPTLSPDQYAAAVAALDVDAPQRRALLDRDHEALNGLLDGRPRMLFYINTPSPDEPIPFGEENDVPDEDEPAPLAD